MILLYSPRSYISSTRGDAEVKSLLQGLPRVQVLCSVHVCLKAEHIQRTAALVRGRGELGAADAASCAVRMGHHARGACVRWNERNLCIYIYAYTYIHMDICGL